MQTVLSGFFQASVPEEGLIIKSPQIAGWVCNEHNGHANNYVTNRFTHVLCIYKKLMSLWVDWRQCHICNSLNPQTPQ